MNRTRTLIALLAISTSLGADTLGFVEQNFSALNFEKGKWARTVQLPCFVYTAEADGATVDVLRIGMGNLVPFKAKRGMTATVCGYTIAFEEGFETGIPIAAKAEQH